MSNKTLMARIWSELSPINVNQHIQKKVNLSYLSWTWAWSELMSRYPESYYLFDDVVKEDGSVMVSCVLTIHDGDEVCSRSMWLPVMDHKNKAIIQPNARDISDTRMRCLVKCIAMFGLGFYIYAGEDIPQAERDAQNDPITLDQANTLTKMIEESESDFGRFLAFYKINDLIELNQGRYDQAYKMLARKLEK